MGEHIKNTLTIQIRRVDHVGRCTTIKVLVEDKRRLERLARLTGRGVGGGLEVRSHGGGGGT